MGGAGGLPFEQHLEDAIDGILQRLGYNFSAKREKQAFLTRVPGQSGADSASVEIAEHRAQGLATSDPAKVDQARPWRDDWNAKPRTGRDALGRRKRLRQTWRSRRSATTRVCPWPF
jgi:hypothetical protein